LYGVCPKCHRHGDMDGSRKCHACGNNTLRISPASVYCREIAVEGARPTQAELQELQSCAFGAGQMSDADQKAAEKKWNDAVGMGIVEMAAGAVLTAIFIRSAYQWIAYIGFLLLLHGGWQLISNGVEYFYKNKLLGKQKTPRNAFYHYWVNSVFNEDERGEDPRVRAEHKSATALRQVPEIYRARLDPGAITSYIGGLNGIITELAQSSRSAYGISPMNTDRIVVTFSEASLPHPKSEDGVAELETRLECVYRADFASSYHIDLAKLVIRVKQTCIRNGENWFLYDLTPAYTEVKPEQDVFF
ncbi:MAG TPA: hypothetical protein VN540_07690, partial [Clostridia bacterium]|nr:hypothetical protein [Clostridia bacterium]